MYSKAAALLITVFLIPVLLLTGCGSKKDKAADTIAGDGPAGSAAGTPDTRDLVKAPLTGELVPRESAERRPLAVMVENSPAARPQSGLDKADLVYEMLAEGAITRFMAVYMHSDTAVLGPVRSARPYFIVRALDYDAIYAYSGGSEAAKKMVRTEQVATLDEFGIGRRAFWRIKGRKAPHNLYTDTVKLRKVSAEKGYKQEAEIMPFKFLAEEEDLSGGRSSAGLTIYYPRDFSVAAFEYDQSQNLYLRSTGGRLHKDNVTGEQLTARNIIVQYVNTKVIDQEGRRSMKMTGSGRALLFTGGQVYEGRWHKSGLRFRTVFTDENGTEFKLNPGRTWISIVPINTKVDY
jgi:hypothetical protein